MKRSSYRFGGEARIDSIDMAGILMLLSRGGGGRGGGDGGAGDESRVFECKTCSRRFPSYQALGGHRASHKKPRLGDKAPKQRSHECSVCGLEFAAGQALGGHMRRHRVPSSSLFERGAEVAVLASGTAVVEREGIRGVVLDLNLPAPLENSVVDLKLGLGLTTNLVESVDN